MIKKKPSCTYEYRRLKELVRKRKMGTNIIKTTNSRKTPYTDAYNLRKDTEEKKVINEINRLNLYSDYNV